MVCTLRGVCVTCQTSACKRLSQFYSSEAGWVLVDSYTLEKAVEWIYKLKEEQLRISRRSGFALCCESEYLSALLGRSISVSAVLFLEEALKLDLGFCSCDLIWHIVI